MDFLKLYFRQHKKSFFFFLFLTVVFTVSFSLYHLPLKAVCYPILLCLTAGIITLCFDLYQCKKKAKSLNFTDSTSIEPDLLPEAASIDDACYQQIIRMLLRSQTAERAVFDKRIADMTEYYTLWAHQIKTPIASMYLDLQDEDTALSRSLTSGLFRIEQYVDMVLAYMRLDSHNSDYVFKEQPIDPIIRGCIRKFAREFISRKINLQYETLDTTLVTDEKWFAFVLEQLLSNALKYTKRGSIRIYQKAPKILCVEDTGIGIASEDLPRIFELGYTGCNGRSDKKASGIGLYLCKKICDNLHIGIAAYSEPDHGTRIELDLAQYKLRAE